jgi:hypothetical protein
MDISSAALRQRVRSGQPITYLVPDACQRLHRRAEALHVTSEQLLEAVADLAVDKKALDIVELDLRGVGRLHRLLRDLLRHERPPGQGDLRRDPLRAEGRTTASARAASRA